VGFRPIVESTMISFHRVWGDMGARQYRFIHAVEGYAKSMAVPNSEAVQWLPSGSTSTRRPLQPEATGAVMEVTKWLKPSV